jgi:hypothetical protein
VAFLEEGFAVRCPIKTPAKSVAEADRSIRSERSGREAKVSFHHKIFFGLFILLFLFKSCDKAPKYKTPTVQTPPSYKELTPANFKETVPDCVSGS